MREFWYDNQLKRYLIQFMAIFADMRVKIGEYDDGSPKLIPVPIYASSKDRVVAAIKGDNTQNKPIRVPTMSAWITGIELNSEYRTGSNVRRTPYMPTGGLYPNDITVVEQRKPSAYKITCELSVWASNSDQHYQILEQIMMLFNPGISIQTSDDVMDWTRITQVNLTTIGLEETIPSGTDRRLIRSSLIFDMPIWISAPASTHKNIIEQIYIRVGAVSSTSEFTDEIINDFDMNGQPYELIISAGDVDIS